jgi:tetratricopeptide (TPR) repeat protein
MSTPDARGNPCSSSSKAASDAAETALWRMMSFYDAPLADLDTAMAADAGWALPHIMKAGFLLSLTEPALVPEADAHLSHARALARHATPREKAHLQAVQMVLEGRWHAACRVWDELLLEHPRDALALQWAQLWDFYRGDAPGLRLRPARALPAWDEADPLFPHVLALYAFGLEESNLYPQAEEAGRRALALQPRAPWAVHAVAHVMEMQGRFEEGSAWLRQHQAQWAEGNGFACHLWWHKSLFRLEAMDVQGVLRLVDAHLSGEALQINLQRVDAAAMLWRLHLLGEDITGHARALLEGWALDADSAGHYAFNDVHAVLAMLGAVPKPGWHAAPNAHSAPRTHAAPTTRWRAKWACR